MAKLIEARVIQKVDTEANWMANPLPLYQGEIAFVSDKYNFKLNTTETPKTFAELEYYYRGDIIGGVLPTDNLASKPNGVYRATISGTYSGVVVKEGYYTLLRKDNGVWKLESEVEMPTLSAEGKVEEGDTQAVSGGEVFNKTVQKTELFKRLNLFDKTKFRGGYINGSGDIESPNLISTYKVSEEIEIQGGEFYTISGRLNSPIQTRAVVFIDVNGNKLKPLRVDGTPYDMFTLDNANQSFKAPDEAIKLFFQIAFNTTNFPQNIQLEEGLVATAYKPYEDLFLKDSIQNEIFDNVEDKLTRRINLFDKTSIIEGKYISHGSGNFENGGAPFITSPIIPVVGGETYYLSGRTTYNEAARALKFVSLLGENIKPLTPNGTERPNFSLEAANGVVIAPENAVGVQFNVKFSNQGNPDNIQFELGDEPTQLQPYDKVVIKSEYLPKQNSESSGSSYINNVLENVGFSTRMGLFSYPDWIGNPQVRNYSFGKAFSLNYSGTKEALINIYRNQINNFSDTKKISLIGGAYSDSTIKTSGVRTVIPTNKSSIQFNANGYSRHSEYIHPSIAYSEIGVGGYKYWMFASNYTNENPRYEDDDLLVSNDAVNWYRLLPTDVETNPSMPVLPPKNPFGIPNDNGRENSFVPIPNAGMTFIMNGSSYTPVKTLKHDPEIFIENNEVFCYNYYNFFDDASDLIYHRFVVVFSTTNGRDWFICRTDGSKIPATLSNCLEIFTQSNIDGKNNYIRYFNNNTTGQDLDKDTAMQVVKVSDTEYYAYYGEYQSTINSNMGMKRYRGTSWLNFDWDSWEYITANVAGDLTVHQDVFYKDSLFYVIGKSYVWTSADGVNFTRKNNTPFLVSGGIGYKIDTCFGEGGKMIIVIGSILAGNIATSKTSTSKTSPTGIFTFIQEINDFNTFKNYCDNGRDDVSLGALISCYREDNTGYMYWVDCSKSSTSASLAKTEIFNREIKLNDNIAIIVVSSVYKNSTSQRVEVGSNLIIE